MNDAQFPLLKPKPFAVTDQDGITRNFILSRIPAVAGREILCQYPLTAMPKIGEYKANEEIMLKLMSYVGVAQKGKPELRLTTQVLIDNHCGDAVTGLAVEREMFKYNFGFFLEEKVLSFFDRLALMMNQKISEMLTASLQPSSRTEKPPSTN